jgi:hypothetical protein
MAAGFIHQFNVPQYVNTAIYTVTNGRYSEFTVDLLNKSTNPINLSIAISNTTNPANNEYVEQGILIPAKSSVQRTGLIASAGKRVVIQSTADGITATAYGIETTAS